jgi:hypothetical protein
MEDKATCVQPKPEKTSIMSPKIKAPGDYWLSDLEGGSQVRHINKTIPKLSLRKRTTARLE